MRGAEVARVYSSPCVLGEGVGASIWSPAYGEVILMINYVKNDLLMVTRVKAMRYVNFNGFSITHHLQSSR
jgi:hypothetical protein